MSRTPQEIRLETLKSVKEELEAELEARKFDNSRNAELGRYQVQAKINIINEEINCIKYNFNIFINWMW